MLHVDLWYRGLNVLRDGGSFMYYHEDPRWQHYFHSTAAHNTLEVDGHDQMIKGPRFLWFRWPAAHLVRPADDDGDSTLEMVNQSYSWLDPPVEHRRTITRVGDSYTIHDTLTSSGHHTARFRWRLTNSKWSPDTERVDAWSANIDGQIVQLSVSAHVATTSDSIPEAASNPSFTAQWCLGDESLPAGWESLYYGEKSPRPYWSSLSLFTSQHSLPQFSKWDARK